MLNILFKRIDWLIAHDGERDSLLQSICDLLKEKISHYHWVGFYLVDPQKSDELVLGPYAGEPTDHTCIRFGQGICGQAAQTKKTFVVADVSKETNYLSCSVKVKSEIVVPIMKDGTIVRTRY